MRSISVFQRLGEVGGAAIEGPMRFLSRLRDSKGRSIPELQSEMPKAVFE